MNCGTSAISSMRVEATPKIDPSEQAPGVGIVRWSSAWGSSSIDGGRGRNRDRVS